MLSRYLRRRISKRCEVRFAASTTHIPLYEAHKRQGSLYLHPTASNEKLNVPSSAYLRSISSDIFALQNLLGLLASNSDVAHKLTQLVHRVLHCHDQQHRVFVTGIGKSGTVAQRLASTLSSISISSQWIHGGDWVHGELGCLKCGDVVILVSHSGRTSELLALPDMFRQAGCCVMAVIGDGNSTLSKRCDLSIVAPADDEDNCPVPSRSIIVQEAICNAIVQHLIESMADSARHLRENHPAGAIAERTVRAPACS